MDDQPARESWLNGAKRTGRTVMVGCGVHCAGCGKCFGITTVIFEPGFVPPEKDPDWPFDEETCPVHIDSSKREWKAGPRGPVPINFQSEYQQQPPKD